MSDDLKARYNQELARFRKAEAYMDDRRIPRSEKEKYLPAFRKLIQECGLLTNIIGSMTRDEILNGFPEVGA